MSEAISWSLAIEGPISVAALMSAGSFERLAELSHAWVGRGADPIDLREAAYIGALFCGFPRGVAALSVLPQTAHPHHFQEAHQLRTMLRRDGLQLFTAIHRDNAERQLAMLDRLSPDFADTVLCEAYGRVLSRDRLPLVVRELIGVASLTVQGLLPQLRAHLRGARNTGASEELLDQVVDHALALTDDTDGHPRALVLIQQLRAAR